MGDSLPLGQEFSLHVHSAFPSRFLRGAWHLLFSLRETFALKVMRLLRGSNTFLKLHGLCEHRCTATHHPQRKPGQALVCPDLQATAASPVIRGGPSRPYPACAGHFLPRLRGRVSPGPRIPLTLPVCPLNPGFVCRALVQRHGSESLPTPGLSSVHQPWIYVAV